MIEERMGMVVMQEAKKNTVELHLKEDYEAVWNLVKDNMDALKDNDEFLWRASRAHFDRSEQKPTDKQWQQDHFQKAHDLAAKALKINEKNGLCHKWLAITLSALGDYVSTKEKIGNAYKIKEHLLKAIELNPDGTTYHVLGRWCFAVSNIGWMERSVASALFASPPSSSFQEALDNFMKSEELSTKFDKPTIRNRLYIGDSLYNLKKYAEAKEWYKKAAELKPVTELDKTLQTEARNKMAKL